MLIRIPEQDIQRMLHKQVHIIGYWPGCVWNLLTIEGRLATLQTPKTIQVPIRRLAYTNKYRPFQEEKQA